MLIAGFLKREVGLGSIFAGISVVFALAGVLLTIGYLPVSARTLPGRRRAPGRRAPRHEQGVSRVFFRAD